MPPISPGDLEEALARLRRPFEGSRRLASTATVRAAQLAEAARTRRRLLAARELPQAGTPPETQIWEAAAREIAIVTRERDRIVATVAHELRQPLAAAVAAERLLAAPASDAVHERARAVLARQLQHLAAQVEALLEYSRLTLQPSPAAAADVDVNAVAADAVEAAAPLAAGRRQTLGLAAAGVPAIVRGDVTQLRQAVSNLLHNALRYTPEGGRIDVVVAARDGEVQVDVRDTGEGFAPDRAADMFMPFVRLSASGGGLGIGLPLVKRIVELHGGRVTASSAGPGTGSLFTIALRAADRPGSGR